MPKMHHEHFSPLSSDMGLVWMPMGLHFSNLWTSHLGQLPWFLGQLLSPSRWQMLGWQATLVSIPGVEKDRPKLCSWFA
jgi:hypothetical protein